MMTYEEWRARILGVVRPIADEAYQRRVWFGIGPEVDSPDERLCAVFDDYDFPSFLRRHREKLTQEELCAADSLLAALNEFADSTPKHLVPSEVIDDPRWLQIRERARRMVEVWSTG